MSEEGIARIEQSFEDLDLQRREQIEKIKARPSVTQDRIEKVNDLWRELVKIHKAAEILFFDNPEIRDLFKLPKRVRYSSGGGGGESQEEIAA